jgi:FkbM family methyltransferase
VSSGPAPAAFAGEHAIVPAVDAQRVPAAVTLVRELRAAARHVLSWQGRMLRHQLPSGINVRITNRSEWNAYNEVMVDGEYDRVIQSTIAGGPQHPLILDLGAHAGFFTMRFADLWRRSHGDAPFRIVSVEGSPDTVRHLAAHLAQPALRGCTAHHGLVGRRSGSAKISRSIRSTINSIVAPASPHSRTVPFVDLESLVPADRRVAVLKCDIEGAEELFVSSYGELLRRVDGAVFELHEQLCDVDRCRALLAEAGLAGRTVLRVFPGMTTVEVFTRLAT